MRPKSQGHGISNTYENYDRGRALFPLANSCRDPVLSKRALAELRSPSSYETAPAALLRLLSLPEGCSSAVGVVECLTPGGKNLYSVV